jgi:hypothetical protein
MSEAKLKQFEIINHMKCQVKYYDINVNAVVTKNCDNVHYSDVDGSFSFCPLDDPPRIYKDVIIDRPRVRLYQLENGMRLIIDGYQSVKSGGCARTTTTIEMTDEQSV